MLKYAIGGVAALLLGSAGIYWWSGSQAAPTLPASIAPKGAPDADAMLPEPPTATTRSRDGRRFARYDLDKNGQISRTEYLDNRTKAFARLDADRDGKLSFDEWSQRSTDRFVKADNDRSGTLDAGEFAATRPMRRNGGRRGDCPPPGEESAG